VTLLPDGGGGQAATLGGWQLAVSQYSKHPREAVRLVQYLTSREVQVQRSVEGAYLPTIPELYDDPATVAANPYYSRLKDVFSGGTVARPSSVSGAAYAEVSFDYFTAVHSILTGQTTATQAMSNLQTKLSDLQQEAAPR
jgi:trehalose/maltose transport system substrate-binding protein